jgi:hypothetical protein
MSKTMNEVIAAENERMRKYADIYIHIWNKIPEGSEGLRIYFKSYDSAYKVRLRLYNVKKAILRTKYFIKQYGDKMWRVIIGLEEDNRGWNLYFHLRGSVHIDEELEQAVIESTGKPLEQLPTNYTMVAVDPTIDLGNLLESLSEADEEPSTPTPDPYAEFLPKKGEQK